MLLVIEYADTAMQERGAVTDDHARTQDAHRQAALLMHRQEETVDLRLRARIIGPLRALRIRRGIACDFLTRVAGIETRDGAHVNKARNVRRKTGFSDDLRAAHHGVADLFP